MGLEGRMVEEGRDNVERDSVVEGTPLVERAVDDGTGNPLETTSDVLEVD